MSSDVFEQTPTNFDNRKSSTMTDSLLRVENVVASYGKKEILKGVSIRVERGEIVSIIGPNGAGKSTLLKTIMGLLLPIGGRVLLNGMDITRLAPHERAELGIGYLHQGGSIFPSLSVLDNLKLAAVRSVRGNGAAVRERIEEVFTLFPELAEVKESRAGILSGGQRQMLSLAMVTLRRPVLLLLDEPSAGLAPKLVDRLMAKIEELNREHGMTMLLVEQNIRRALAISRRAYSLRAGVIANEHREPSRLTEQESFEAILQA
jgi:ABC-type branched-subunit amino acid transport system ATPase component